MFEENHINENAFYYYSRLKRVKEHVEEYYFERISLRKAAQIAGLETSYFCTFFRKKVGVTFTDWLRRVG